jgi:hypothetical protein
MPVRRWKSLRTEEICCQQCRKSYRAIDRNLLINISQHTTVQVVPNPPTSIPKYIYRITPLPAIKPVRFVYNYTGRLYLSIPPLHSYRHLFHPGHYIWYSLIITFQDTIGYLIKYKAAHTFVPKNKEKAKTLREIYIKDLRYIHVMVINSYRLLALLFWSLNSYAVTMWCKLLCGATKLQASTLAISTIEKLGTSLCALSLVAIHERIWWTTVSSCTYAWFTLANIHTVKSAH